jgi:hypothetical protein
MQKECFQCSGADRESALAMTRLEVAQYETVNIAVPYSKDGAAFNYSIGLLENFNHPEIIVTGLPVHIGHIFLNTFREFIKDGNSIEPEKIYTDFSVGNLPLIFKKVDEQFHAEYLGYGKDYYRTFEPELFEKFSALQMIWCDKAGLFPWQDNYGFPQKAQPLLTVQKTKVFI